MSAHNNTPISDAMNGLSIQELSVKNLSLASQLVHADDNVSAHRAVAPAMHVSTTYRYHNDPARLEPGGENTDEYAPNDSHVYSRLSTPNTARLETVLSTLLGGKTLVYASGLASFHAMLVHLNPKRVAICDGYHGCHGILDIMARIKGTQKLSLDCDLSELEAGDVIHVETPLNPTGEARDLAYYAEKARKVGAYLTVDATFAPPPLQNPMLYDADIIMHSGTKYFGGHSDLLCGSLTINPKHDWYTAMFNDRTYLGGVIGSLEGWLGLRSLRTLELRVTRQSATATALVAWLEARRNDPKSPVGAIVEKFQHASLQPEAADENSWLRKQMPGGWGPVFSICTKTEEHARHLPSKLNLFHHATSLGGIESLIEWRAMSDPRIGNKVLRVSVGLEGVEDLKADFEQAFKALSQI